MQETSNVSVIRQIYPPPEGGGNNPPFSAVRPWSVQTTAQREVTIQAGVEEGWLAPSGPNGPMGAGDGRDSQPGSNYLANTGQGESACSEHHGACGYEVAGYISLGVFFAVAVAMLAKRFTG